MIVDPWGTIVTQAPDTVGIVRAELDLDRVAAVRRQIPVLANRRPEAYLVDPAGSSESLVSARGQ
jgi:predicted amidohydrolase